MRLEDKNTADNSNADISDIEKLWRKRLGLTKAPLDYVYDCMNNKLEWVKQGHYFYNIYKPEYTIEIISDESCDSDADAFYSYAMSNNRTSFKILNIKYQNTIIDDYELVMLDSGRLLIPTPEWSRICYNTYITEPEYIYKYYILGSKRCQVLNFLYSEESSDNKFALMRLKDVVLFYQSEKEKNEFELYLLKNQELVSSNIESTNKYNYIETDNKTKTKNYITRLQTGIALNKLLNKWRDTNCYGHVNIN